MHVDHLHREIFHAECWEFKPLCDNFWLLRFNLSFIYIERMEHPLVKFIIFPCHCAVYMYKIMILQKFHIDPSVKMWLIVYSNDHAPLTVRLIYSSLKLRTAQMMIFSLIAMIGLEKCCITSACLQWLCHSGERTVAHGPLVFFSSLHKNIGYFLKAPYPLSCWNRICPTFAFAV